jgi:Family of unknown function (DUF5996)
MSSSDWRPLGVVDRRSLSEARLQAHYAVQWLARAARAFIPAKSDDSHTNMGWDDSVNGFATHALPGGERLGLSIAAMALVVLEAKGGPRAALALPTRKDSDARAWLDEQLQDLSLDPEKLDAPPPWEMPAHPIGDGAPYGGASLAAARTELAAWFADAARSLSRVRSNYIAKQLAVSPVRCWPHHFDIATLMTLEGGDPEHARSVNAGLSPGDGSYDEPYFYVSPWPYPDTKKLSPLPSPGHWHTEGFLAAVAPATRIAANADQQRGVEEFLDAAVAAAIEALG